MTEPTSAISGVTTGVAPKAKTGRPALLLKGGKPYAEARDAAQAVLKAAKEVVKSEAAKLKGQLKLVDAATAQRTKTTKLHAKGKVLGDPKAEKLRLKTQVSEIKAHDGAIKLAVKLHDAQLKVFNKALAAQTKAEAALAKVEEAKAAVVAAAAAAKAPKVN